MGCAGLEAALTTETRGPEIPNSKVDDPGGFGLKLEEGMKWSALKECVSREMQ